eukprot:11207229-Karenia_brevis.AAC.1
MSSVLNEQKEEKTNIEDIAEVFASFFESLYEGDAEKFTGMQEVEEVEAVSIEEVRRQLNKMRTRKSADEAGIVAELLRESSNMMLQLVADIFTAVLQPNTAIPDYWKASSIRVLFKKGDKRLPENYRPICIVPILYKLFSRVVSERIKQRLIAEQPPDQAGFRPNYSCDDH